MLIEIWQKFLADLFQSTGLKRLRYGLLQTSQILLTNAASLLQLGCVLPGGRTNCQQGTCDFSELNGKTNIV